MNINSVTSSTVKPQTVSRPNGAGVEKTVPPKTEPAMSAKEALAKAFYTREEEPWVGKFYIYGDDFIKSELRPMTKDIYLRDLDSSAYIHLTQQQCYYDTFRKELVELRPDLANKGFSYTLGDDAQVKVIAYENSLSEDDIKWLTKALNGMDSFKESVQSHARIMMTLVDHDTETFGGKYNLNLLNFQDTIDYGKIVAIRKNDLSDEWIKQIHQNAEKRETHMIDIKA
ncbi:hypothetical protein ALQ04_01306 [Pseudomonas cichorii]|uniref:Uncharacterized protein n=1 Tax=Pseudomonas cichorii TaxID=36746 RepID=A0A3M4M854_PSECI|nr:hypothetical protein [Pseudomonas cichorii]RMQ49763.1 hypothetical protein ALQ04_01306 [Pseudomonas cichorii]